MDICIGDNNIDMGNPKLNTFKKNNYCFNFLTASYWMVYLFLSDKDKVSIHHYIVFTNCILYTYMTQIHFKQKHGTP